MKMKSKPFLTSSHVRKGLKKKKKSNPDFITWDQGVRLSPSLLLIQLSGVASKTNLCFLSAYTISPYVLQYNLDR